MKKRVYPSSELDDTVLLAMATSLIKSSKFVDFALVGSLCQMSSLDDMIRIYRESTRPGKVS
jgi:hypothetical protein